MSPNLNYVPWLSLFTVIGIGLAYLGIHFLGLGAQSAAAANLTLLYGAGGGALVGMVVRTAVRFATRKRQPTDDPA